MAGSLLSALRRWFMPGCSPPPMGLAELPTSSKAISSIPNGCRRFRWNSSAGCFRPSRRGSFRKCSIENREITAPSADGDRSRPVLKGDPCGRPGFGHRVPLTGLVKRKRGDRKGRPYVILTTRLLRTELPSSRSRQTTDSTPAFVVVATRSAAHFGRSGPLNRLGPLRAE